MYRYGIVYPAPGSCANNAPSQLDASQGLQIYVDSITKIPTTGLWKVCFGYDNPTGETITIRQGPQQHRPDGYNYLEQQKGVKTTTEFVPGRVYGAFSTTIRCESRYASEGRHNILGRDNCPFRLW